ncbi:ArnT family glycosyltransferase [Candidatus Riflebacteria bacterium]
MQKLTGFIAFLLLLLMFFIILSTTMGDSLTIDEYPHIKAGYHYVKKLSLRKNAEHPPLVKILSGCALQFLKIKSSNPLSYRNNQDLVLLYARLPCMFVSLLLGLFLYIWASALSNRFWGLFALSLYVFEPTILAHSPLVTTDMALTTWIFITLYFFSRLLTGYSPFNYLFFILAFSFALLTKYSALILLPFIFSVWSGFFLLSKFCAQNSYIGKFKFNFQKFRLAFVSIFIIVIGTYIFFMQHYPLSRQRHHIKAFNRYSLYQKERLLRILEYPFMRFPAHYLYGFSSIISQISRGHAFPQYFMGDHAHKGSFYYFIVAFLIKTPVSLLFFLVLATGYFFFRGMFELTDGLKKYFVAKNEDRFFYTSLVNIILFSTAYGLISLKSKLNIGIRHILPIYPFIFVFITCYLSRLYESLNDKRVSAKIFITTLIFGLFFFIYGTFSIYPHYLSYFNEFVGRANGHYYLSDSNLDWGHDLKRLSLFVKERGIRKIKVDYWGRAGLSYYLGKSYSKWHIARGLPEHGFLAVSIFSILLSIHQFNNGLTPYSYADLFKSKPFGRIGYSIYVYNLDAGKSFGHVLIAELRQLFDDYCPDSRRFFSTSWYLFHFGRKIFRNTIPIF